MQYLNSKFRPEVTAFREANGGRLLVRISNRGNGAGVVQDINLLTPAHLMSETTQPVVHYRWEINGKVSELRPIPFGLDGGASAQLFLLVDPSDRSLRNPCGRSADDRYPLDAVRIRVDYGAGKSSGCLPMVVLAAGSRIYGTTQVPGMAGGAPMVPRARTRGRSRAERPR